VAQAIQQKAIYILCDSLLTGILQIPVCSGRCTVSFGSFVFSEMTPNSNEFSRQCAVPTGSPANAARSRALSPGVQLAAPDGEVQAVVVLAPEMRLICYAVPVGIYGMPYVATSPPRIACRLQVGIDNVSHWRLIHPILSL
jgi:hypothetical protein